MPRIFYSDNPQKHHNIIRRFSFSQHKKPLVVTFHLSTSHLRAKHDGEHFHTQNPNHFPPIQKRASYLIFLVLFFSVIFSFFFSIKKLGFFCSLHQSQENSIGAMIFVVFTTHIKLNPGNISTTPYLDLYKSPSSNSG